jgi:isopentenyl-diphosphate Delta-isomerase
VTAELVVLLDADGRPCGSAPKTAVHSSATPLHLAFSCWILATDGRILITRRAAAKRTWPGAWTNAVCGHPAPGEPMIDAVTRRARDELGAQVADVRCVLPEFRYQATMANGTRENEVCPVHVARIAGRRLSPDPTEVMSTRWVTPTWLRGELERGPERYSPWMLLQWPLLLAADALGDPGPENS